MPRQRGAAGDNLARAMMALAGDLSAHSAANRATPQLAYPTERDVPYNLGIDPTTRVGNGAFMETGKYGVAGQRANAALESSRISAQTADNIRTAGDKDLERFRAKQLEDKTLADAVMRGRNIYDALQSVNARAPGTFPASVFPPDAGDGSYFSPQYFADFGRSFDLQYGNKVNQSGIGTAGSGEQSTNAANDLNTLKSGVEQQAISENRQVFAKSFIDAAKQTAIPAEKLKLDQNADTRLQDRHPSAIIQDQLNNQKDKMLLEIGEADKGWRGSRPIGNNIHAWIDGRSVSSVPGTPAYRNAVAPFSMVSESAPTIQRTNARGERITTVHDMNDVSAFSGTSPRLPGPGAQFRAAEAPVQRTAIPRQPYAGLDPFNQLIAPAANVWEAIGQGMYNVPADVGAAIGGDRFGNRSSLLRYLLKTPIDYWSNPVMQR